MIQARDHFQAHMLSTVDYGQGYPLRFAPYCVGLSQWLFRDRQRPWGSAKPGDQSRSV
jgi:hypothetical protein